MNHRDYSKNIKGIGKAFGAWVMERTLRPFIGRENTAKLRDEMAAAVRPVVDDLLPDRIRLSLLIEKSSGRAYRFNRDGWTVAEDTQATFAVIPGNIYTALVVWGVITTEYVDESLKAIVSHSDGVETWFRWSVGDLEAEVTRGSGSDAKTEKFSVYMGYDEKTKRFGWPHELTPGRDIP